MTEKLKYISDEELERLITQVEQNDLVTAPPDLMENILVAAGMDREQETVVQKTVTRKKEFYAYCFRVITSVAAAVALMFLLPELELRLKGQEQNSSPDFAQTVYRQENLSQEQRVASVPSKEEVLATKITPSKEEVLNDSGFVERVIRNTGLFDKENNK